MPDAIPPVVTQLFNAWNSGDVEQVVACYSPEFEGEDVADAQPQLGLAGVRRNFTRYMAAFSELQWTPDAPVIEGDRVAVAWTARGRHQGPLLGIPATGREVAVRGVTLLTLEENHIRRALHVWDVAGLLRALGLLPQL